jgi:hypothetical protein
MRKVFYLLVLVLVLSTAANAQFTPGVISALNVPVTQNFDSLARTVGRDSSRFVTGWRFVEAGTGANGSYSINNGGGNTGDSYSYGVNDSFDRAIGSLSSGSLQSTICGYYVNQTGSTVTAVRLQFTMEQWRSGGRTTIDSSEFFYGINNGGFLPANGTWIKNRSLNLVSKIFGTPAPTAGARNGNDTANQIAYDVIITGLTLNIGDTIYLRWRDQDAQGADDGLAIDNFSITAFSGTLPSPNAVNSLTFTPTSSKTGTITFSRSGYDAATMSTLVFMKPSSAVTQGTPTLSPSQYIPSTDFSAAISTYENDAQARCVLNGDGTSINITGLQANTRYHLLVYVVRDLDSNYSTANTTNNSTFGNPIAVSSPTFLAEGQSTATLSWTKPSEYNNATYTTLVFVKGDNSTIIPTPPASGPGYYTADANYIGNGTKFESDTQAVCVYKGDANSVLVNGLTRNSTYQFAVFTYREIDSLYSPAAIGNGKTLEKEIPASLTTLTFSAVTSTSATINWTKPGTYNNDTHQVVVFLKAATAIHDTTVHTFTAAQYNASADFSSPGTAYEHDASAFAVYNGDGNSVNVTGLNPSTTYYATGYVIKIIDTAYSNPRNNNMTTPAPPAAAPDPVTGITFTQTALRNARISWTKPSTYVNGTHSTLVFVKTGSTISTGVPNKSPLRYTASPLVGNGTRYDFDSQAYCVFRADTNFINVSNLPASGTIAIVIHTVRDADSVYSNPTTGSGSMALPALVPIASINSTNSTTGLPDSNGVFVQLAGVVKGFNQRMNGLQFLLSNNSSTNQQGITVFNTNRNFGYSVAENDSVWVIGTIGSNRGNLQITIDTLWHSGSTTVNVIQNVTTLNEQSENKVVKLNVPVKFLTAPTGTNWPNNTSNISVISATNDTFTVRLINNSALAGTPLPSSEFFTVSGIGAQQSSSFNSPYAFNGYQIIPRSAADISDADGLRAFSLLTPANNTTITLNEPLTDLINITWNRSLPTGAAVAPSYTFEFDTITGNFSSPIAVFQSNNSGADTTFTPTKDDVLQYLLGQGYTAGSTITGKWRVVAQSGTVSRNSTQVFNLNVVIPMGVGMTELMTTLPVRIYPNPAHEQVTITTAAGIESIRVFSYAGMLVSEQTVHANSASVSLSGLSRGIYMIQVMSKDGRSAIQKLVVE